MSKLENRRLKESYNGANKSFDSNALDQIVDVSGDTFRDKNTTYVICF